MEENRELTVKRVQKLTAAGVVDVRDHIRYAVLRGELY